MMVQKMQIPCQRVSQRRLIRIVVRRKDAKLQKDTPDILEKLKEEREKLRKRYQKTRLGRKEKEDAQRKNTQKNLALPGDNDFRVIKKCPTYKRSRRASRTVWLAAVVLYL